MATDILDELLKRPRPSDSRLLTPSGTAWTMAGNRLRSN
jgi:hypothetical protein